MYVCKYSRDVCAWGFWRGASGSDEDSPQHKQTMKPAYSHFSSMLGKRDTQYQHMLLLCSDCVCQYQHMLLLCSDCVCQYQHMLLLCSDCVCQYQHMLLLCSDCVCQYQHMLLLCSDCVCQYQHMLLLCSDCVCLLAKNSLVRHRQIRLMDQWDCEVMLPWQELKFFILRMLLSKCRAHSETHFEAAGLLISL